MSNPYRVQVLQRTQGRHLTIERLDGKPVRCSWDTLQHIKNKYCGKGARMVEFFPEEVGVVNEVNRRHLWEVGIPLPMGN